MSLLGAELCQSWVVSGCQPVQPRGDPPVWQVRGLVLSVGP